MRQVEQAVVNAAADIPACYAARIPEPCAPSALLVLSADCKGIVMRPGALRAATAKAAACLGKMRTRLSAGEKPNRTRMAALVSVYDAEPARRRPHDVIAPPGGRHGARPLRPGPNALAKWLAGSVRDDPADMIAAAFDEAEACDPERAWRLGGQPPCRVARTTRTSACRAGRSTPCAGGHQYRDGVGDEPRPVPLQRYPAEPCHQILLAVAGDPGFEAARAASRSWPGTAPPSSAP
jgi:hypothetical protein